MVTNLHAGKRLAIRWLSLVGSNFEDLPKGNSLITQFLQPKHQVPSSVQVENEIADDQGM
jgi:hypothetical protein